MYLVEPIDITTAKLKYTNIADDADEYNAGTTYDEDDYVIVAAEYTVYQSLAGSNTGNTPADSPTWWVSCGTMNKWRAFDNKVQVQASNATTMQWVLEPGSAVDAVSVVNADLDTVRIIEGNTASELLSNGTTWSGANTGSLTTTPPTGWTAEGTGVQCMADSGVLKIYAASTSNSGYYQAEAVTAADVMQVYFQYKNTAGDVAQYGVYDVTHSTWIKALTALADNTTALKGFAYSFTVPTGCTSIRIYIEAQNNGDVVWFDNVSLLKMTYDTGLVSMTNATSMTKSDVTSYALPRITIIAAKSTTAYVGEIIVGAQYAIGSSLYNPTIDFKDYSTKEADSFGNYTIVERDYEDILECKLKITNTSLDLIRNKILEYRATPAVWIFSATYSCTQIFGYCERFTVVIPYTTYSDCTLKVQGLT